MHISARPHWYTAAQVLAGALLLAIPFRFTVDKRGGILAALVILLVVAYRGQWRALLPQSSPLRIVGAVWLGATTLWAVAGAIPLEALRSVRSDVLAPILAFCVFYTLTPDRRALMQWGVLIGGTSVALAVAAVLDPYQPTYAHWPIYVDVGVLASWLIVSSSLIPVLWQSPKRWRTWARPLAVVMVIAILVAAVATVNRVIWICFALMILSGAIAYYRGKRRSKRRSNRWLWVGITVAALATTGWASIHWRAPAYGANNQEWAYVLKDPRPELWRTGLTMFAERPFAGYGFGTQVWRDAFQPRVPTDIQPRSFYDHAHNATLNYGLQMGVVGVGLIFSLFGALAFAFACALHTSKHSALAHSAASCGIALVLGFYLRNTTDDYFSRQSLLYFAAVAGMLFGASTPRKRRLIQHGD